MYFEVKRPTKEVAIHGITNQLLYQLSYAGDSVCASWCLRVRNRTTCKLIMIAPDETNAATTKFIAKKQIQIADFDFHFHEMPSIRKSMNFKQIDLLYQAERANEMGVSTRKVLRMSR